ncbi:MAG: DUF4375 domain-containing protein [Flavipsychrobacter sp.]
MGSDFIPEISKVEYSKLKEARDASALYEYLCQPLHEQLYKKQDFNYVDELSEIQQLIITYDYVKMQVLQGGFIQLIQNGYVLLLPSLHDLLQKVGATGMAQVIDDALKVYVLNRELLDKEYSVDDFAKLYVELTEFEDIDNRFSLHHLPTINTILLYAEQNMEKVALLT